MFYECEKLHFLPDFLGWISEIKKDINISHMLYNNKSLIMSRNVLDFLITTRIRISIMILGSSLVGKTSFVEKFLYGISHREDKPTIGVNPYFHKLKIDELKNILIFNILDTNGTSTLF